MPLAARLTDKHSCPLLTPDNIPHLGNEIDGPGEPTVLIGYQPAARVTDIAKCQGPVVPGAKGLDLDDPIVEGSGSVFIGSQKAARVGDHTAHGGTITSGHLKVKSATPPRAPHCSRPEHRSSSRARSPVREGSAVFKIRKEQKVAFRAEALRGFEDRVLEHWRRCLGSLLAARGEEDARALIRAGIEGAGALGVSAERDVVNLLDLMLYFGVDFARERAWAREVLAETAGAPPSARVRDLYVRAMVEA